MIALDIETTGLDPNLDAVTEIAALRFKGARVEDTFQTLVNPNRPIPSNITQLTHITNEMVRNAPQIGEVIGKVAQFVGNDIIVGHNISFDLNFLRLKGILQKNLSYDTYDLASILLPDAPRYNLGVLAQRMGIIVRDEHRALADCYTTYQVFNRLIERAESLPAELLADIVNLSEGIHWNEAELFRQIIQKRIQNGEKIKPIYKITFPTFLNEGGNNVDPLKPSENPIPLEEDEMAAILEYGGAFSKYFPNYEQRSQQIEMLRTVTTAFSKGKHMFIEAGTGTGKSFAYLIPAFHWAKQNGERVIVSTNTINLQEQLIRKDIPELNNVLQEDFRAAVLKGRSNYLCPRRVQMLHSHGVENADELRVLSKVLVWLYEGGKGDRGEINLNGPIDREIWERLNADFEGCRPNQCPHYRDGQCPFYAAKAKALKSHVIIVNHALLLTDMAYGNDVLPEYKYLIIDEGHHLESAATGALSVRITQTDLSHQLQELGGYGRGLLGRIDNKLAEKLKPDEYQLFVNATTFISENGALAEEALKSLFETFQFFMKEAREGNPVTVYGQQLRITSAIRTLAGWADIEIIWDKTEKYIRELIDSAEKIDRSLMNLDDIDEELRELIDSFHGGLKKLSESKKMVNNLIVKPDPETIYWIEISPVNNRLSLNSAPLHVGNLIEKMLWHEKESIIVTSATLTADNSFDYIRDRLSADEAEELVVGSPFDYENSVLLFIPNDIPDPNQGSAQHMVDTSLINLCKAVGGRTLALFTSYAQLKRTSTDIAPEMQKAGITIYEQGEGASASSLLETFRETDQAILLGTRSFWEGVDIQGEKLSVVVIVKLPFDVPSDPIFSARSEGFENPFSQYSLPEAILKFRQGFGRLIRSQSDRGVVVILDNRVLTKRYGREFLNSIPKCTERIAGIRELPREAQRWLNL